MAEQGEQEDRDAPRLDPYALLGVDADVPPCVLRERFLELARLVHPDCGGNAQQLAAVRNAYEFIVSSPPGVHGSSSDKPIEELFASFCMTQLNDKTAALSLGALLKRYSDSAPAAADGGFDVDAFNRAFLGPEKEDESPAGVLEPCVLDARFALSSFCLDQIPSDVDVEVTAESSEVNDDDAASSSSSSESSSSSSGSSSSSAALSSSSSANE